MDPHDLIRDLLDRVRARWHALRAFQAAVRAGLAASAVLIAALMLLRGVAQWAGRPPLVPAILAAAALLLVVWALAWAFAPLRHRPSDARVARFIEERVPALDDRLVSAVDVINGPPERGHLLRAPMLADAAARARAIDLDTILPADGAPAIRVSRGRRGAPSGRRRRHRPRSGARGVG